MTNTTWTPVTGDRQLWAKIEIGNIGQVVTGIKLKIGSESWTISIDHTTATIRSDHNERGSEIDARMNTPEWNRMVKKVEIAVSYMRALVTFAFETPTKRGFESNVLGEIDDFYPTSHELRQYAMSDENHRVSLRVATNMGSRYNRNLHDLVQLWRRGYEFDEMNYFSEAYLNFYKIFESIGKKVPRGTNPRWQVLKTKYIDDPSFIATNNINAKDVRFAGSFFVALKFTPSDAQFLSICRVASIRNNYGIAHAVSKTSFKYSSIGQYDDYYESMVMDLLNVKEIARYAVLVITGYKSYWLDGNNGSFLLRNKYVR